MIHASLLAAALLSGGASAGSLFDGFGSAGKGTASQVSGSSGSDTTASSEAGSAAALIVLGESVDDVQTPSTAADLAVSLGGIYEDGALSDAYAIEVSPAWLGGVGKNLTLREYAAGGLESILWNSNLSFATTTDDDVTRTALAYRTTWWASPPKDSAAARFLGAYDATFRDNGIVAADVDADACVDTLANLSRLSDELARRVHEAVAKGENEKVKAARSAWITACADVTQARTPEEEASCTAMSEKADALEADLARSIDKAVKRALTDIARSPEKLKNELGALLDDAGDEAAFDGCEDLLTDREGFLLDIAGGVAFASPDAVLADTALDTARLWLAPGWARERFSVTGLLRLSMEDLSTDTPVYAADLGAGLGVHWPRFTLSPEVLVRAPIRNATTEVRATLGLDVRVMQGVWFTTEVGGSWPSEEAGSFVTFAGLTFGVQRERPTPLPAPNDLARRLPAE